ncbi:MAG: tol-pal system YbgF family protein [Fidelibacterota bacterium]
MIFSARQARFKRLVLFGICIGAVPWHIFSQTTPTSGGDDFFLDLGIVIEPSTGNEKINRFIQAPPEKVKLFIDKAPSGSVYMASTKELQETLIRINRKIESLQLAFQRQTNYLKEENNELRLMITDLMEQVNTPAEVSTPTVSPGEKHSNSEEITTTSPIMELAKGSSVKAPNSKEIDEEQISLVVKDDKPAVFNRMLYMNAVFAYQREDYQTAIRQFKDLAVNVADDITAGNVIYWMADCHFQLGQPTEALSVLSQLDAFKGSDKLDDAKILEGLSLRQLGRYEQATAAFAKVVEQYPESEYYRLAQMEFNRSKR